MPIHTIKLQKGEWQYDDSKTLGEPGGFGEVFLGSGECREVAIKQLKISVAEAAHRELSIGEHLINGTFNHIVPVLDAGQDAESDRYYLVMPVCDYSLQNKIDNKNGSVDLATAKSAILGIITGLSEVPDIVHRDLKPANILFHNGQWKIADFGIAKFVEDSTSLQTLRNSLTPQYAAPEQWRGERSTAATDIYALGCIIHTLFSGTPPFSGSIDVLRDNHLNTLPSPIEVLAPRSSAFVINMLRKVPQGRPTLERCANVLSEISLLDENKIQSNSSLDDAAKLVAETTAREEAKKQVHLTRIQNRNKLFSAAKEDLQALKNKLFSKIQEASENVEINSARLRFGNSTLNFSFEPKVVTVRDDKDGSLYRATGWSVIGWSTISIYSATQMYTWSSSLLYADQNDGNGLRWYEVSFYQQAGQASSEDQPFSLDGNDPDIDLACGNIMHSVAVAYGPFPIDCESEDDFILRWSKLVAKAALGDLNRPTRLPITTFD